MASHESLFASDVTSVGVKAWGQIRITATSQREQRIYSQPRSQ